MNWPTAWGLNRLGIISLVPYLIIGSALWLALFYSGIHPTLAGVLLALMIPDTPQQSPLRRLENGLHPWVAYLIMPLFALSNAGFSLTAIAWTTLMDPVVLGIALGLFLGKQLGVFGGAWLFIKSGLASLPKATTWLALYGTALLCGIGFTMSLFLGTLSFANENIYLAEVRLGVIIGSILSGITGAAILSIAFCRNRSVPLSE